MRGYHWNHEKEEQIRSALSLDAYSYDPPTDLKQRIDARMARQKKEVITMKRMSVKKVAVVATAVCALSATVCMAAGKVTGYIGGTRVGTQTSEYADVAKLEKKLDLAGNVTERFSNGYAFRDACITDWDAMDDNGNRTDSTQELSVTYAKGDGRIHYTVAKGETKYTEDELESLELIRKDDQDYYYSESHYLFLPTDVEPTKEELAAEEAGDLFISYGSDEREEKTYLSMSWNADGKHFTLGGFDLNLNAQDMIDMAMQLQ